MTVAAAKIDTSIIHMLGELSQSGHEEFQLISLDTEPTSFAHKVVFDIAFRSFAPFGSKKGKMDGGLVYEVITDREIMTHIASASKIASATEASYYFLLSRMDKHKWFGSELEDTIYAKDVRSIWEPEVARLAGTILEDLGEKNPLKSQSSTQAKYNELKKMLKLQRERISQHYDQMEDKSTGTLKRRDIEADLAEKNYNLILLFDKFLASNKHMGDFATKVSMENKDMSTELRRLRKSVLGNYMRGRDLSDNPNPSQDLAIIKSTPGGETVDYLDNILTRLDQELKQPNVAGIIGHNVGTDLTWIENTIRHTSGASQWKGKFKRENVSYICSMNLFKRLDSMDKKDMSNAFLNLNAGEAGKLFAEKASQGMPTMASGEEGKKFTLQVLYNNIVNKGEKDISQTHTARGDVDWVIELTTIQAKKMIEAQFLTKGK